MIFSCLVAFASMAALPAEESIDADQFARLISTLHAPIQDISFVYEGEFRYLGPSSKIRGGKDALDRDYQGFYALRSDGATLLDLYDRFLAHDSLKRTTSAMLKWQVERFGQFADHKNAIGGKIEHKGDPGTFFTDGSPERILFLWYFQFWPQRWISDPGVTGYEFQGWEDVDGHRCLRVQRDALIHSPNGPVLRFWIDVARGGHPLKYEMRVGGKLEMHVEQIKLDRIPIAEGKEPIWLPVSGVEEDFLWDKTHTSSPMFRSTYALVNGSVRVNQGLDDDQFTLHSNLFSREPALANVRRTFDTTPPVRTDPEGVRLQLDAALAKANRESEQLKASSPAAPDRFRTMLWQFGFAGLGSMILGFVVVQIWRRR